MCLKCIIKLEQLDICTLKMVVALKCRILKFVSNNYRSLRPLRCNKIKCVMELVVSFALKLLIQCSAGCFCVASARASVPRILHRARFFPLSLTIYWLFIYTVSPWICHRAFYLPPFYRRKAAAIDCQPPYSSNLACARTEPESAHGLGYREPRNRGDTLIPFITQCWCEKSFLMLGGGKFMSGLANRNDLSA